jgi:two-component system nitrate/nitrite response regulator NarL
MKSIKVLIADDHALFAELLSESLSTYEDINVVGVVFDGLEVLSFISQNEVDVILLDLNMPNLDGLKAISMILEDYPKIKIIVLSSHTEAWIIQKSIQAGASGYLTKFAENHEVFNAIVTVTRGGRYFCKKSLEAIMQNQVEKLERDVSGAHLQLTAREKQILQLIAKEKTTAEIAEKLFLSTRTIETHRRNILLKLGAKSPAGLIKAAMDAGLIESNGKV